MDTRLWSGIVKHLEYLGLDPLGLFKSWKLGPGSGWENVGGHCLVQAGAHLVFDPIIGFGDEETLALARTALCHNLRKRVEKRPADFSDNEMELLGKADPWGIVDVFTPKFLVMFVEHGATFHDQVLFIIDDMARDDKIVSFDDRIDEVSARNPDPEPAIREQLGRSYWDVEREVGHIILTGMMVELRKRDIKVATMSDIPRLINAEMAKKFIA